MLNPAKGRHLYGPSYERTVMTVAGTPKGTRRLLSAVDILAAAELSGWHRTSINPASAVPEPGTLVLFIACIWTGLRRAEQMLRRAKKGLRLARRQDGQLKNWPRPTAGKASLMCSIVGCFAPAGQVMAMTSKRAGYSSRPCDLR